MKLIENECSEALTRLLRPYFAKVSIQDVYHSINKGYSIEDDSNLLTLLIMDYFGNPPLKWEERVKFLEKQLDIAIKELCFTAKGADACNSLDNLYEGIKEWIEEQARKEVRE